MNDPRDPRAIGPESPSSALGREWVVAGMIGIYIVTLALSLYRLDLPLLEFYPVRQVQTADITRNLYRADHNILYPSRYEGRELQPFVVEFPLYNGVVALTYAVAGGVHESLGRLVSVLCWIGAGLSLFVLVRRYYGDGVGLASLFFFHMSRLGILASRSFQPDAMMVMLSLAALALWDRWFARGGRGTIVAATTCFTLALLVKLPIGHTAVPILYLAWIGSRERQRRSLVVAGVVTLAIMAAWYLHARHVTLVSAPMLTGAFEVSDKFALGALLGRDFYARLYVIWRAEVFGSIVFALALYGTLMPPPSSRHAVFHVWLASVVAYLLVFNRHAVTHDYYHLPLVAVGSVFAARAFVEIPKLAAPLLVTGGAIQAAVAVLVVVTTIRFTAPRAYTVPPEMNAVLVAADAVRRVTRSDDAVVTPGNILQYLADRPGWSLPTDLADPVGRLEQLREQGADVFVAERRTDLLKQAALAAHLRDTYPIVEEAAEYVIFDLTRPKNAGATTLGPAGVTTSARRPD